MRTLRALKLEAIAGHVAQFRGDNITLRVFSLEADIFRVTLLKDDNWVLSKTWSIAWDQRPVPFEGNPRDHLKGFSCPAWKVTRQEQSVSLVQGLWEARVDLQVARIDWFFEGKLILPGRTTGSFAHDPQGRWEHHHALTDGADFYGLGEASGALSRRERRFEMRNLDAMGYDAEKTDPLYKHYPFLIHRNQGVSLGLFYDNFATCEFNLGLERDNYHGPYFSYKTLNGDFDLYVVGGPSIRSVSSRFTKLTGLPMMPPAWSQGYSGSTMTYTDAPDAQTQMQQFLNKLSETKLPCKSFHLSSGYTSIGPRRYVFNWNRDKFPDPAKLIREFAQAGVRIIPNVKPVLLTDHPAYDDNQSLFVQDSQSKTPELSQFWDGLGSHLDFTNPETVKWWKTNLKEQLFDFGIQAVWNDNNEFEVWDEAARTHAGWPIGLGRPVQTLLMAKASREALQEYYPDETPFVISRSGMPGMQRYVQSWSGDNRTEWKTLRFNLFMALNLSLSGMANTGHDIGGFSGPKPDEELFLRWIQHGIFYPRFVIHSWKADGVNEPWMYLQILPQIQKLFQLRETLRPYMTSLLESSHKKGEAILRPLFYDYESDAETFLADDIFMLGDALLIANVMEAKASTRRVYLPKTHNWRCYWSGKIFNGGQRLDLPVSLETWPMFVRSDLHVPGEKS